MPQLRLVLLTSADPALPLHRLRIDGELVEIRSSDLAFGVPEALQLFADDGVDVAADQAELLVDRTEGWPAGLRLAALFLSRDGQRSVAEFAGDDRAVSDYLLEEVLSSQPADLQEFLTQTSVVDRVSSDLAEVLSDQARSQRFLETLERSNAFVVGLGTDRKWFRYHPLLREMLQHQLGVSEPALAPELHRRAAAVVRRGTATRSRRSGTRSLAEDWTLFGRLFVDQGAPLLVVRRTGWPSVRVLAEIPEPAIRRTAPRWPCAPPG